MATYSYLAPTWITSQTIFPLFRHLFELGRLPFVREGLDVTAGRLAERTVVRLGERRLIGASKRDDRNVVCVDGVEFSQQEADKNNERNLHCNLRNNVPPVSKLHL